MVTRKTTEKNNPTFLFHDYETFGIDPKRSKASQFACIRTDHNLNILDEDKLNIYCEFTPDYLPSPVACLVTKQTPQHIQRIKDKEDKERLDYKARTVMNEDKFSLKIFNVMSKPNTCSIGYNNVDFDDEWSRNLFYRNLRDPYSREWQNNCSRADGINFILYTYLIDPSILNFPQARDKNTGELLFSENGRPIPSFKLEELSLANGIIHENAHDAFSDVLATIYLLKIIKEKNSAIFDYVFSLRSKRTVSAFLNSKIDKPFLHVSSFYGKENFSKAVVQVVGINPNNPNAYIALNISKPIDFLINLTKEEIKEQLFMTKNKLAEKGLTRPPIQTIVINQCAVVCDLSQIKHRAADLNLDGDILRKNRLLIQNHQKELTEKIMFAFEKKEYDDLYDSDLRIYDGFFSKDDSNMMKDMHYSLLRNELGNYVFNSKSQKTLDLFFKFKARNYPDLLNVKETEMWIRYSKERITGKSWVNGIDSPELIKLNELPEYTIDTYLEEIDKLKIEHSTDQSKLNILKELIEYGKSVCPDHPYFLK